jgi:hypothetical protein
MATAVCLEKDRQRKKERLRLSDQSHGIAFLIADTFEIVSPVGTRRPPPNHTSGPFTISLVGVAPLKLWSKFRI